MPVSILTHGAAGDGTTDDTAALVAALAAAGASDYVLIPAGTYRIDGPVTLGAVTREIRGESGSILKTPDSHPGATARMFAITGDTTLTIRDLTLQGPTSSNATYKRRAISQTETGSVGGTLTMTQVNVLGYWQYALEIVSGSAGLNGSYTSTLNNCNLKAAESTVKYFGHDAVQKTLVMTSTTVEKLDASIADWTMYIHRHHVYTWTDCTITGSAQFNLHIYSGGHNGAHTFTRCTFAGSGGNLLGNDMTTATYTSCAFTGQAFWPDHATATFTSCTFTAGGGTHTSSPSPTSVTFTSCTFAATAELGSTGTPTWTVTSCTFTDAALNLLNGTLTATSCTFTASASLTFAVAFSSSTTATLTSCTFTGQYAHDRGALRSDSGTGITLTVTSCTFAQTLGAATWIPGAGNTVTLDRCTSSGTKGTILAGGGTWTIKNCLAYGKTAAGIQVTAGVVGIDHCVMHGNTTGLTASGGTVTVKNSIIFGNTTNLSGTVTQVTNLVGTNPLFIAPESGNFRLSPSSVAARAGTQTPVGQDFTGAYWPDPFHPDIGAYGLATRSSRIPRWSGRPAARGRR